MTPAVLFDLDGTLVDSFWLWRDALASLVVARHGRPVPDAIEGMAGMATEDAVALIGRRLGWPAGDAALNARFVEDQVRTTYGRGVAWYDGALQLVTAVHAKQAATALVTSSTRHVVETVLADPHCPTFTVVVCGDDVSEAKPSPAPYLKAADDLKLEPAVCVAVEDSAIGVASALAAGCAVIAVGDHAVAPELPRVLRVGALTEITVEDIASLTKQATAGGRRVP